jgi:hypothetical protein
LGRIHLAGQYCGGIHILYIHIYKLYIFYCDASDLCIISGEIHQLVRPKKVASIADHPQEFLLLLDERGTRKLLDGSHVGRKWQHESKRRNLVARSGTPHTHFSPLITSPSPAGPATHGL